MITVAYDPQIFLLQKRGGISRYFVELIKAFQENPDFGVNPVLIDSKVLNEYAISDLAALGAHDGFGFLQPWRELLQTVSRNTSDAKWDIVHHTFYLAPFLAKYGNVKRISTLHDMIPELCKENKWLPNKHFQKKRYLEKSNAIISVSNSTLTFANEYYSFELETKSTVVHHGITRDFGNTTQIRNTQKIPYVLFVGNRTGYKQGATLIKAFSRLVDIDSLNLIFVGGGEFLKSEMNLIVDLSLQNRVSQIDANDEELSVLYRNALAFIMPSLYEGFGLPALEAMAAGCPVILSDASALSEVGGAAALYFPSGDESSLAGRIREVVTSSELRNSMSKSGINHVEGFSWKKCAQETASVYRRTLGR
jgi:glycosyltransferase involved in cell wall biosynthesis